MAEALYRKYRPRIFEDVVGQEHIERTIKNAIAQDKVSHAYLFCGPRGTGKTTTARLLAKALLCEKGPTAEPDGTCDDCEMIAAGAHPDVYELDAASRTGVENVREEIIGRVQFAPTRGGHKVYIIDEVHMLSTAAFNALLKTLEEPPSHVVFVLCTTDPQKVPETIHSRCQRFDFRRISNEAIVSRLGAICMEEGVEFEGDALELVAQRAEGGMRNALTSLEQLIAFGEGKVTLQDAERMLGALDTSDLAEIMRALGNRDVAQAFRWTADYVETGADLAQFTRDLAEHVRTMYVLALSGGKGDVVADVSETVRREMAEELPLFGPDRLARMLGVLGDLSAELRVSTNPRLSFEIALTRMMRPDSDLTLEALAERIERLERQQSGLAAPMAVSSQQPVAEAAVSVESAVVATAELAAAPQEVAPDQDPASQTIEPHPEPQPVQQVAAEAVPSEPQPTAIREERPAARASEAEAAPSAAGAVQLSERIQHDLQNPAALQRLWQAILSHLKQEKAAYGVLFLNTKAVYDGAKQHLTIEFPAESDFAFSAASKTEATEELVRSIERVCAAAIPFSLVKGTGATAMVVNAAVAGQGSSTAQASSSTGAHAASTARAESAEHARPASEARHGRSAATPQTTPEPVAASAPSDDPYYDEVPLDAYGDFSYGVMDAPVADEPAPMAATEPSAPAASPAATVRVQDPSSVAVESPSVPAAALEERRTADSLAEPVVDAASTPTPVEPSASDLDAMLAFGFGDGLSFTEVDD